MSESWSGVLLCISASASLFFVPICSSVSIKYVPSYSVIRGICIGDRHRLSLLFAVLEDMELAEP